MRRCGETSFLWIKQENSPSTSHCTLNFCIFIQCMVHNLYFSPISSFTALAINKFTLSSLFIPDSKPRFPFTKRCFESLDNMPRQLCIFPKSCGVKLHFQVIYLFLLLYSFLILFSFTFTPLSLSSSPPPPHLSHFSPFLSLFFNLLFFV